MTAWFALVHAAELQAGETILIVGAAGAVGQAATQIANWRKARVLGAARGSNPIPGADAVINTTTDKMGGRCRMLSRYDSMRGLDTEGILLFTI